MTRWVIKPAATAPLERLQNTTPARIGTGRSGTRSPTDRWLGFRLDHALARDAVKGEFSDSFLTFVKSEGFPIVQSDAVDKADFIAFPPKGRITNEATIEKLKAQCQGGLDVQILISDGLSARAIEDNIKDLLPILLEGLGLEKITPSIPIVARYARVALADQIAHALKMKLAINLIGERPGMSAADSMSAYLTYNPGPHTISSDRTVISNIHARGTLPVEAGAHIVQLAKRILSLKMSGVKLQQHT